MGTEEAVAVTPQIFIGEHLAIPHVEVKELVDVSTETLGHLIQEGDTLLFPPGSGSRFLIVAVLRSFGLPITEAREKINRALGTLPDTVDVSLKKAPQ